jgi:membrane protein required for colicin V production
VSTLTSFNLLDVLLALIIAGSFVGGYMAGFAKVGISFMAAIAGLLFGFWFYGIPAEKVHKYFESDLLSNFMGFLLIFLGCIAVGGLLAGLLSKLFKWTGLTWLDRLFGAAFGVVRGSLVVVAFVAVLMAFTPRPKPDWMVESQLLPYAVDASDLCSSLAPSGLKNAFQDGLKELRKAWDDQLRKSKKKKSSKEAEV